MSSSTHPIIVLSDSYTKDAFTSTNTPDYTPASPDYFTASPGNTFSDPSEDLSKDLLASLAISPFHNDPYMKVMQILPSRKQARSRSSSSTSALPQVFKIGESSYKTSLERHEEQIETILKHLDELPLEHIEHMEDKIKGLEQIRHDDEIVLARARKSTLEILIEDIHADIKKLVANSVAVALEAQASTMANDDNTNRNTGQRETPVERKLFLRSNYTKDCKVKFATSTLTEEALSWWNSFAQPIGIEESYKITWSEFKELLIKKYCPRTEIKKMEDEFYNLTAKGNDLKTYVRRFQELEILCPTMVPNSEKLMMFHGGITQEVNDGDLRS
ncbi:reverse transcriptase domain-containing protein [Tanacetum coccineum]